MARRTVAITRNDIKRIKLEPYQRQADHVGKGRHHWESFAGMRDASWADFARAINRRAQNRVVSEALRTAMTEPPEGTPLRAWVENNRWIARCECGGQETIDPEWPYFYCFSCRNGLNRHRLRPLELPTDWRGVEDALLVRPDPLNRCMQAEQSTVTFQWEVLDHAESLAEENEAHGLPRTRGAVFVSAPARITEPFRDDDRERGG